MEFIYVLKCQKEKYFISKTYNVQIEYNEHLDGTFCDVTKEFKPYDIDCIFEATNTITLNKIIAKYLNKHGSKNIYFLDDKEIKEIKKMKKNDNNKCICSEDHWLIECKLNTKDKFWTNLLNKVVNKLTVDFKNSGICFRCGRYGHDVEECYCKTHIEGFDLSDSEEADFTN
jgi:hypothetical protein